MGECSFWYRPTRAVPDQRPLNGRCCCYLEHENSKFKCTAVSGRSDGLPAEAYQNPISEWCDHQTQWQCVVSQDQLTLTEYGQYVTASRLYSCALLCPEFPHYPNDNTSSSFSACTINLYQLIKSICCKFLHMPS